MAEKQIKSRFTREHLVHLLIEASPGGAAGQWFKVDAGELRKKLLVSDEAVRCARRDLVTQGVIRYDRGAYLFPTRPDDPLSENSEMLPFNLYTALEHFAEPGDVSLFYIWRLHFETHGNVSNPFRGYYSYNAKRHRTDEKVARKNLEHTIRYRLSRDYATMDDKKRIWRFCCWLMRSSRTASFTRAIIVWLVSGQGGHLWKRDKIQIGRLIVFPIVMV